MRSSCASRDRRCGPKLHTIRGVQGLDRGPTGKSGASTVCAVDGRHSRKPRSRLQCPSKPAAREAGVACRPTKSLSFHASAASLIFPSPNFRLGDGVCRIRSMAEPLGGAVLRMMGFCQRCVVRHGCMQLHLLGSWTVQIQVCHGHAAKKDQKKREVEACARES